VGSRSLSIRRTESYLDAHRQRVPGEPAAILEHMAIELSDEEFDLLYRSLRATVEQTTEDDEQTVVELEDLAWQLVQEIARRSGYPLPTN
jgi:hypothetical protein